MKYEYHEYANLFPMMPDSEIESLAIDIKENGLMEPIVLCDGKILDGRNRFKACEIAKIKPAFKQYDGGDPLGFVVSHNLHRRHLDESQRAMIAGAIANMPRGERTDLGSIDPKLKSTAQAASLMNVSTASVKRAKKVITNAIPVLQDMVTSGEVAVSTASKVAMLPKDEQAKAVRGGVSGVKSAAKFPIEKKELSPAAKQKGEEAERDSEKLWLLKSTWKTATKKDKSAFCAWIKTNN